MFPKTRATLFLVPLILFSCASTKTEKEEPLRLLFAGDIMAHTQNYQMGNYDAIWDDVRDEIGGADFSFANIEAPVDESRPFESYPTFNMKESYPAAALRAGFNLISLANNHSDDQDSGGIRATAAWAKRVSSETESAALAQGGAAKAAAARPVYFSGLTENGEWSDAEFYWNGRKIIFLAATELVNTWKNYALLNFIKPDKNGRAAFVERVRKIKEERAPDLFIVSIHTSEEEYVLTVLPQVERFYYDLLEAGCDILVSNHPHVVRPVDFSGRKDDGKIRKAIMFANGNTISGQRRALNYARPDDIWQYTGDGQLVLMELLSDERGFFIAENSVQYITCYTSEDSRSPVIKKLDENFIQNLKTENKKDLAAYYEARLGLLKKIKGKTVWQ